MQKEIQKPFWYAFNTVKGFYVWMYTRLNISFLQMDSGLEVSDWLYESGETIVQETGDEASPNNNPNEQSDDYLVPSLRRTKSIPVRS